MLNKQPRIHYALDMNRLPLETRAKIVGMMVEGNSLRSISRMCDVSINTVSKLLVDLGDAAMTFHDETVRGLRVKHLQCDEIWAFVGAEKKNVSADKHPSGWGDVWIWTAIDADTKLCVSYLVGGRDAGWAHDFMQDCADRIYGHVQLTTDGHKAYLEAGEDAFSGDVDYAQLQKIYGAPTDAELRRYSPAKCIGADMKVVSGDPDPAHVSTSYVERQNLTMRMSMRRFTRLTNGFSKKLENHVYAVAIHFLHYNFARVHKTLRVTPAMEAGIADHVWTLEEMAAFSN
jgi:IS1 family transposase